MMFTAQRKKSLSNFFNGRYYPPIIASLALVSSIFGFEVVIAPITAILTFAALWFSDSVKPFIITLCTAVMHVSVVNSPFYPNYSDVLFSGYRMWIIFASGGIIIASALVFIIRKGNLRSISLKRDKQLLSLLVFSVALLFNGAFSSSWVVGDLIFGSLNVAVYLIVYIVIYYGTHSDDPRELGSYFAYVSALIGAVVTVQLVHLYLTSDGIFADGSIVKVSVALGWAIWNIIGTVLVVLIPMLFYGMHRNRYPWLYFVGALVVYAMSVLSMSRNALVFGTLAFVTCVIVSCFTGKNRKVFRIITVSCLVIAVAFAVVFYSKISALLGDYIERGFSDNGRFNLWKTAVDTFAKHPIFGAGFYGFKADTALFGPLPEMAHQVILQLLSSAGIIGLAAYLFYLFFAFRPLFTRPFDVSKLFIAFSALLMILGSMLDNFVFNFFTTFHYTVALVILKRICESDVKSRSEVSDIGLKV